MFITTVNVIGVIVITRIVLELIYNLFICLVIKETDDDDLHQ